MKQKEIRKMLLGIQEQGWELLRQIQEHVARVNSLEGRIDYLEDQADALRGRLAQLESESQSLKDDMQINCNTAGEVVLDPDCRPLFSNDYTILVKDVVIELLKRGDIKLSRIKEGISLEEPDLPRTGG